jgi:hypothetical protein
MQGAQRAVGIFSMQFGKGAGFVAFGAVKFFYAAVFKVFKVLTQGILGHV